ncbi:hypothetical protein MJO28_006750 [Puccinia striiformis f. sp. tritici]|uniref:Uncharacterized protein n=3 Tax=Puccinia striiformis TaxID=27350 RepID=A0A0L0UPY3_9BASI|nr:hypothetical protein MJO28_006750 [Puccinia striiformis f. sp. tritici]KNE89025.1 hypothetical protein PSTG_17520 [Puccinia striiformis f. sp. tritici PST-78]POV97005.1 hypothetical protein PSTT_15314 [Puccinia striiformis]
MYVKLQVEASRANHISKRGARQILLMIDYRTLTSPLTPTTTSLNQPQHLSTNHNIRHPTNAPAPAVTLSPEILKQIAQLLASQNVSIPAAQPQPIPPTELQPFTNSQSPSEDLPVEGVIPVEGNMAKVATNAELHAEPAAEHNAEYCTNKNKNAPEDWCIPLKKRK